MPDTENLNQWIEIDAEAYLHNLRFFRNLVGTRELCAVIKANAYGHGIDEISRLARDSGMVDSFGVHTLDEAHRLSGLGMDVLIMGYTPAARLKEVVEHGFRQVVYDEETLKTLDRIGLETGRKARVHLKVETGTNRQGTTGAELRKLLEILRDGGGVAGEGIYTHFANIEDTTRHDYARRQMEEFESVVEETRSMGLNFPLVHSACSAAVLLFPGTWGNMVRLGISQYGLWPSRETLLSYQLEHRVNTAGILKPVLSWKCRISQIKNVTAGSRIGYGCTYLTTRPTKLAVLPVGYWDGYDRALSHVGYVLVNGRRAQVRGRVCMNLVMVDVTDIENVKKEDEVVLLGCQGDDVIAADDLAAMIGTINYEVTARLRREIPRIVV